MVQMNTNIILVKIIKLEEYYIVSTLSMRVFE